MKQSKHPTKMSKKYLKRLIKICKDWPDKLPFALWWYRTSIYASTGATPFSLVCRMEAVFLIEIGIPSLRIIIESQIP